MKVNAAAFSFLHAAFPAGNVAAQGIIRDASTTYGRISGSEVLRRKRSSLARRISPIGGEPLKPIDVIDCKDIQIDLVVREHRWNVDGVLEFNTRAYFYNDKPYMPGPTIVMYPGHYCRVNVTNELEGNQAQKDLGCYNTSVFYQDDEGPGVVYNSPMKGQSARVKNVPHCPDNTNLHTHGLHVSPTEDNVVLSIPPKFDGVEDSLRWELYDYKIPDYHLMGTHWYHAHFHGASALQVSNGLVGQFFVAPADDYVLPSELKDLYDGAIQTFFQFIYFGPNSPITDSAFIRTNMEVMAKLYGVGKNFTPDIGIVPGQQTIFANMTNTTNVVDFITVNGQYKPSITLQKGKNQLLRMSFAGWNLPLELKVTGGYCSMQLIARDGIFHKTPYLILKTLVFTPGTRQDVVFRCSDAGELHLTTSNEDRLTHFLGPPGEFRMDPGQDVLTMIVEDEDPAVHDEDVKAEVVFPREEYLLDLIEVSDKDVWHGDKFGTSRVQFDVATTTPLAGVNGQIFRMPDPKENRLNGAIMKFCPNEVYEFDMITAAGAVQANAEGIPHVYHHHISPFVLMNDLDPTGEVYRIGEFRDIVFAPPDMEDRPGPLIVRFYPYAFGGVYIMHCHILAHEDTGMMGYYWVDRPKEDKEIIENTPCGLLRSSDVQVKTSPKSSKIAKSSKVSKKPSARVFQDL